MNISKQNLFRPLAFGFLSITLLITGTVFCTQPTYAQSDTSQPVSESETEISQQELQKFAQAYKNIQKIKQDSEVKMVEAVQNQGLSPERFIQISEVDQNPQAQSNNPVTTEERQGFESAKTEILQIRQESESQMAQAIQSEGLEISRFNEIIALIKQNSNLREQVQQMVN